MKLVKAMRIITDIYMYLLFILLMGQHLLAGAVHEYMGIGLFACFFVHCALNYRWYRGLFKGKYTLRRSIWAAVNMLLLVSFVICIFSSFMISGVVFRNIRLGGNDDGREKTSSGRHRMEFCADECPSWPPYPAAERKGAENMLLHYSISGIRDGNLHFFSEKIL